MIPVVFNPYPDPSVNLDATLAHATQAAENLRNLTSRLGVQRDGSSRLQGRTGLGGDSLRGAVLLRKEGGEHVTLPALLSYPPRKGSAKEPILWLWQFFSQGTPITEADVAVHDATTLEGNDLPVPLLGYAAAQGGIASTVAADADWQQEFFRLCNPAAEVLNVSSASRQDTLTQWTEDWLRDNLEFTEYLQTAFTATFCPGSLNTLPPRPYHASIGKAFVKAREQSYACDGDLIKRLNTEEGVNLLELRAYGAGARVFFQLKDGRPHIAGFYTKGQAVNQQKAIQQAARRCQLC